MDIEVPTEPGPAPCRRFSSLHIKTFNPNIHEDLLGGHSFPVLHGVNSLAGLECQLTRGSAYELVSGLRRLTRLERLVEERQDYPRYGRGRIEVEIETVLSAR